ncbi:unnamed protein product [Caenorhabditis brenneri]
MSSGNIVKLNIGGTVFQTTKSTLMKFDGFFQTMLKTGVPRLGKDETGAIFIDRSPKHFELILNYMRDGSVNIPDSKPDIQEIQVEAQFYSLHTLSELCKDKLPVNLSAKLRFIESDAHLLHLIAVSQVLEKPVLVIYYQMDGDAPDFKMPNFNIARFVQGNQHRFDIWFRPLHDSKTRASCFRIFRNRTGSTTFGRLDQIDLISSSHLFVNFG